MVLGLAISAILWISFATSFSTNGKIYYVKPFNETKCTHHQHPCHTLMFYVSNVTYFFTSTTQLLFLPGCHTLEVNAAVQVSDITNFTMKGIGEIAFGFHGYFEPTSTISCVGHAGFKFHNVDGLQLQQLTFRHCEQAVVGSELRGALVLDGIANLTISGIMVHSSGGYGLHTSNLLGNSFISDSAFLANKGTSEYSGGNACFVYENCVSIEESRLHIESSHFMYGYNHPTYGSFASGIDFKVKCNNVSIKLDDVTMYRNTARDGGNLAVSFSNDLDSFAFNMNNTLIKAGSGFIGGGMLVYALGTNHNKSSVNHLSLLLQITNTLFIGNSAQTVGGGVYIGLHQSPKVHSDVGEISFRNCTFHENIILVSPTGRWGGVAVNLRNFVAPEFTLHSTPQFCAKFSNCTFSNNSINTRNGSNINLSGCGVILTDRNPSTSIGNSTFMKNTCTAITAINSNVILWGSTSIQENVGYNGGGMALYQSAMNFLPHTIVSFTKNHATRAGGGIYINDETLTHTLPPCFFQLDSKIAQNHHLLNTVHIRMENNSAEYAGSDLFGGSIDNCYLFKRFFAINSSFIFNKIFDFRYPQHDSYISSCPLGVCLCDKSNKPDCNISSLNVEVFPGKMFEISAVVIGQRNGTVPGNVLSKFTKHIVGAPSLGSPQDIQAIHSMQCSPLRYEVFSNSSNETLILTAQQPSQEERIPQQLQITLKLKLCPPGFTLSDNPPYHCQCAPMFAKNAIICFIENQMVQRSARKWIGSKQRQDIILFTVNCPFNFCKPYTVNISIKHPDEQCNFNRTGVLCGACPHGLSVVLGSSRCLPCSNIYLLLLIPFALTGLLLVLFLIGCNLTVSEATINGLLFYANIIYVNKAIFFQGKHIPVLTDILTVFIAWLNLDLGIETCFYDGMDAYAKAWLQFAYLAYLWSLIGMIILSSHKFILITRLVGRNAGKVVATVFLITYSKLQLAAINAFQYVNLHRSDGESQLVWMSNGNIQYLTEKHIPLFITAVVLMLLSMCFALVLVFIQCLQKRSSMKLLFWVKKFKPALDAYTGPCRDNHRFWPGLLLIIRTILFTVYTMKSIEPTLVKCTLTIAACVIILIIACVSPKGTYKKWCLNMLEFSYVFNLCLLSLFVSAVHHLHLQTAIQACTYTSVSIALLTFTGIILYHTYRQVVMSQKWRKCLTRLKEKRHYQRVLEPVDHGREDFLDEEEGQQIPPVVRFDQFREPLLAFHDDD